VYYYVLPGVGIYGGVKKAFQCVDFLTRLDLPARIATPGGEVVNWFEHGAQTVAREDVPDLATSEDILLFSLPQDAAFVLDVPASRRIVHMQGANTSADSELIARYPQFDFISHGHHMSMKLSEQGVAAPYVPNSVSAVFETGDRFYVSSTVAVMPRKGHDVLDWLAEELGESVRFTVIDGQTERQTAKLLQAADIFLAISAHEAFGLPALEAMAAGCCVIGYPGDGGYEFMHHGTSAHVVPNGDRQGLLEALRFCLDRPRYRDHLRRGGARIAALYTPAREQRCLYAALRWLRCV